MRRYIEVFKGNFYNIPRPGLDGDKEYVQIRLMQGLFVELNLKNGDVEFNERTLNNMKMADGHQVQAFMEYYGDTLEKMALGGGQTLGFGRPIEIFNKTPFPCAVQWSSAQMFEAAEDIQE